MNIDFLNANAPIVTTSNFDYNSFYRAVVMSVDDPEQLGRIRVKIPSLHANTNNYPYAYPATMTGLGYQVGQYILPPVGSIVFIGFEYGDEHRIIYFGGIPTKFVEGKTQSYGSAINSSLPRTVTSNDIPTEFTGSQAIIYKAPSGAIIYTDSNSNNKKVYIGNVNNQALIMQEKIIDTENAFVHENQVKLQLDDDSYIQLVHNTTTNKDEFHLFLDGEEIDIGGGGGGTGDYQDLVNKPQINSVTLNGNLSLQDIGVNDATLTFTRSGQTIGTFTANSSTNTTIDIPDDVQLEFLTKSEIDDIYNSL